MENIELDLLVILYITAHILSSLSYIPQIIKLLKDITSSKSVSIFSWGIWVFSSSITLTYAVLRIQDTAVIFASIMTFSGSIIILSLLLFNRFVKPDNTSILQKYK